MYKPLDVTISQHGVASPVESSVAAVLDRADVASATITIESKVYPKRVKYNDDDHQLVPVVTTNDEEIQATNHHHQHAFVSKQIFPPDAPPAWFIPAFTAAARAAITAAINKAIDPAVTAAINRSVGPTVDNAFCPAASIGPAVDNAFCPAVSAANNKLLAIMDNQDHKRHNKSVIMMANQRDDNVPSLPIKKEADGNGIELSEHVIVAADLPDDGVPFAIGVPIPSPASSSG